VGEEVEPDVPGRPHDGSGGDPTAVPRRAGNGDTELGDVFRTAMDNMLDSVAIDRAVRDGSGAIVDLVIEYLNPVASDLAGRGSDELIGQRVLDAYPGLVDSDLFAAYCEVADTGRPIAFDAHPYRAVVDGAEVTAWFHVRAVRIGPDRILIVTRDVTHEREATDQLHDAVRKLEAAQALAHIGIWELDVETGTFGWSDELYRIFDLDPTVTDEVRTRRYLESVARHERVALTRAARRAMVDGQPFLAEHTLHLPSGETAHTVVHGDVVRDDDGTIVRVWGTMQDVTESTRTEYALEATANELEREHETVDALQRAILPELPDLASLELAACYLPAGTEAKVGGDWYDVFVLDEARVGLVVGDVAGHGLPSAALMAQLRNGLRAYALQGFGPAETLSLLNRFLRTVHADGYATCLYGIYEPGSGAFTWAHAGHLPPIVVTPGAAAYLEGGMGTPLGAIRDAVYVERSVVLDPHATLVLYTDGLIERRGEVIDRGLDRLLLVVADLVLAHFGDFCAELSDLALEGDAPADDVCVLALRCDHGGGRPSSTP
jgi:serine phosphatase RsbU (regulator of sigma subunit)/PAS domain-containing protein